MSLCVFYSVLHIFLHTKTTVKNVKMLHFSSRNVIALCKRRFLGHRIVLRVIITTPSQEVKTHLGNETSHVAKQPRTKKREIYGGPY